MPVDVTQGGAVPTPEAEGDGVSASRDTSVRSKILAHFIKGKVFSLTYGDHSDDSRGTRTS